MVRSIEPQPNRSSRVARSLPLPLSLPTWLSLELRRGPTGCGRHAVAALTNRASESATISMQWDSDFI